VIESKQLSARHEKNSPAIEPAFGEGGVSVGLLENPQNLLAIFVLVFKPSLGRSRVVGTIPRPLGLDAKIALEEEEKIVGRHLPARKKVATHPVVFAFGFEGVGELSVSENMNEKLPPGPKDAADFGE
jgi:hypothetical protein